MEVNDFGRELKHFRIDRGIKQKDMAKMLGLSASYLSSMESGNKEIISDFMERMQQAFPNLTEIEMKSINQAIKKHDEIKSQQEKLYTALNEMAQKAKSKKISMDSLDKMEQIVQLAYRIYDEDQD